MNRPVLRSSHRTPLATTPPPEPSPWSVVIPWDEGTPRRPILIALGLVRLRQDLPKPPARRPGEPIVGFEARVDRILEALAHIDDRIRRWGWSRKNSEDELRRRAFDAFWDAYTSPTFHASPGTRALEAKRRAFAAASLRSPPKRRRKAAQPAEAR